MSENIANKSKKEIYYEATQWQLMWWKLKRHKLAVISGLVLAVMYASIFISEFLNEKTSTSPR